MNPPLSGVGGGRCSVKPASRCALHTKSQETLVFTKVPTLNSQPAVGRPSTKTCEIPPCFLQIFFWVRIMLKKFTQVLSYAVCTQVRRNIHKHITKTIHSFVHSRSGTYYALLLGYFGLKFLPDIGCCVYRVLAKI